MALWSGKKLLLLNYKNNQKKNQTSSIYIQILFPLAADSEAAESARAHEQCRIHSRGERGNDRKQLEK